MSDNSFKALVISENDDGTFTRKVTDQSLEDLPEGEVLLRVRYSSLNYKDGLSCIGNRGVTRNYPHTPGIDASGEVAESSDSRFKPGDQVLVTGYDLGMNTSGGFGQYIRVPADWVVQLPEGLSLKEAMIYGTAGYTAALSVHALQKHGITPEQGEIVVTGSTGGVGSIAVMILSKMGYDVHAVTGKKDKNDYLKDLGAKNIIDRKEFEGESKLLEKGVWDGVVDTVGGSALTKIFAQTKPGGIVAACGNAGGIKINTNVMPFIIRGVKLWGIDSSGSSIKRREFVWGEAAKLIDFSKVKSFTKELSFTELLETYPKLLKGEFFGRAIVNPNK